MIWFGNIDSTSISWNSHLRILLNLRELFTAGIAVDNFFLCVVHTDQWGVQATMYGSQKSGNPWLKCHENEEKIYKRPCFEKLP